MEKIILVLLCFLFLCFTACNKSFYYSESGDKVSKTETSGYNSSQSVSKRNSIKSTGRSFNITPYELIDFINNSRDIKQDPYFMYPKKEMELKEKSMLIYSFGDGGIIEMTYDSKSNLVKKISISLSYKPWKSSSMDSMWYYMELFTYAIDSESAAEILDQIGRLTLDTSQHMQTIFRGNNVEYQFSIGESDLVTLSIIPK